MALRRWLRWSLFLIAAAMFIVVVAGHATWGAVGVFFVSGGIWYWLGRWRMLRLDARRFK